MSLNKVFVFFISMPVFLISNEYKDKNVVKQKLAEMVKADQALRSKVNFANVDDMTLFDKIRKLDCQNVSQLKEILKIYDWVNITDFGKEADHDAWLLVQHADHDLDFQKFVLEKLSNLYPKNETAPKHYAYLYDRVAKAEGRPQRYGTQGNIENSKFVLYDVENKSDLDQFRSSVGLEPINDYIEMIKSLYGLPH